MKPLVDNGKPTDKKMNVKVGGGYSRNAKKKGGLCRRELREGTVQVSEREDHLKNEIPGRLQGFIQGEGYKENQIA